MNSSRLIRCVLPLALMGAWGLAAPLAGAADNAPSLASKHQDFQQGLLWKVEKSGIPANYVFGTIHLGDERVTKLPAIVQETLKQARSFTMEIVTDDIGRQVFVEAMLLERGDLRKLIGDELFARTAALMQESGVPPDITGKLKPWGVLLNLIMSSGKPGVILDNELLHAAMLQHKPVYQLESVDEQIALFDDIPTEIQIALLKTAVGNYPSLPEAVEKTIAAYLARDLKSINDINEGLMLGPDGAPHYEYFITRVVHGRNVIMAHRMQARLREGNAFFAVGAMHLYGEKGVLSLLEQEGFKVTRMY